MQNLPNCPKCQSQYVYEDGSLFVCPECGYEWSKDEEAKDDEFVVRDANGNILQNGDSVTIIKDLKIKGSSSAIKVGTKIKNIRLVEGSDGHNIECKIPGVGAVKIAQKFVKKS